MIKIKIQIKMDCYFYNYSNVCGLLNLLSLVIKKRVGKWIYGGESVRCENMYAKDPTLQISELKRENQGSMNAPHVPCMG
jgi:hypothetical protein